MRCDVTKCVPCEHPGVAEYVGALGVQYDVPCDGAPDEPPVNGLQTRRHVGPRGNIRHRMDRDDGAAEQQSRCAVKRTQKEVMVVFYDGTIPETAGPFDYRAP